MADDDKKTFKVWNKEETVKKTIVAGKSIQEIVLAILRRLDFSATFFFIKMYWYKVIVVKLNYR